MSILFFEWPQCFVKFFVKSINETEILEQSNQTTAIRMTLRGVAIEDSGIYLCEGYNEYENVSATSKLIVWPKGKLSSGLYVWVLFLPTPLHPPPPPPPPPQFPIIILLNKNYFNFSSYPFPFPITYLAFRKLFFKD